MPRGLQSLRPPGLYSRHRCGCDALRKLVEIRRIAFETVDPEFLFGPAIDQPCLDDKPTRFGEHARFQQQVRIQFARDIAQANVRARDAPRARARYDSECAGPYERRGHSLSELPGARQIGLIGSRLERQNSDPYHLRSIGILDWPSVEQS